MHVLINIFIIEGEKLISYTTESLKRNSKLATFIGKSYLKMGGWKIEGNLPEELKFIIIVGPHTSNWDFIIGAVVSMAVDIRASFFGKHTLFKIPILKSFVNWLGGIPVERSTKHGFVDQMVTHFKNRKSLMLALSPEGTRKKVDKWKTGFYYISSMADVPIVPLTIDYKFKKINFHQTFKPSGNLEKDLDYLLKIFNSVTPKKPKLYNSTSAY